jgi:ABC-type transporter Mla maintaining outer membrane lipid asymmetry ATPase subunit MlaF
MAMLARRKIVASGTVAEMKASTNPDVRAFFDARKS